MSLPPLLPPSLRPSLPTVLFSPGRLKPSGFKSLPLFKGKKGKEGQGGWRFVGWVVLKDSWPQLTCGGSSGQAGSCQVPRTHALLPKGSPQGTQGSWEVLGSISGGSCPAEKDPGFGPPPRPGGSVLGRVLPGSSEVPRDPSAAHGRNLLLSTDIAVFLTFWPVPPSPTSG